MEQREQTDPNKASKRAKILMMMMTLSGRVIIKIESYYKFGKYPPACILYTSREKREIPQNQSPIAFPTLLSWARLIDDKVLVLFAVMLFCGETPQSWQL